MSRSNDQPKPKFTWHYYIMASGALLAMLAGTVGSLGGVIAGLAIAVLSHPLLPLQGATRFVFYVLFMVLYVFAFPDADVVREMMAVTP